jgi:hypothetical protein
MTSRPSALKTASKAAAPGAVDFPTTSLYEATRANQEFESFLSRSARIAAVSNMWDPSVLATQYLGSTPDG